MHVGSRDNSFREALLRKTKSTFRFSREIQAGLEELVHAALTELGIAESVPVVSRRFRDGGFVEGYFDEQNRFRGRSRR
jgi:hypothetical protein